jgi:fructose-specific component phosphotransferase system IIB-like protein
MDAVDLLHRLAGPERILRKALAGAVDVADAAAGGVQAAAERGAEHQIVQHVGHAEVAAVLGVAVPVERFERRLADHALGAADAERAPRCGRRGFRRRTAAICRSAARPSPG